MIKNKLNRITDEIYKKEYVSLDFEHIRLFIELILIKLNLYL